MVGGWGWGQWNQASREPGVGLGENRQSLTFPPSVPGAQLCKQMSWSSSQKAFSVTALVVSLTSFVHWNLSPC